MISDYRVLSKKKFRMIMLFGYGIWLIFLLIIMLSPIIGAVTLNQPLRAILVFKLVSFGIAMAFILEKLLWLLLFSRFPLRAEFSDAEVSLGYYFKFQNRILNIKRLKMLYRNVNGNTLFVFSQGVLNNFTLNNVDHNLNAESFIKFWEAIKDRE